MLVDVTLPSGPTTKDADCDWLIQVSLFFILIG